MVCGVRKLEVFTFTKYHLEKVKARNLQAPYFTRSLAACKNFKVI